MRNERERGERAEDEREDERARDIVYKYHSQQYTSVVCVAYTGVCKASIH